MEENEEQKQSKVVDIQPISKGKRMLVFLADFFLVFIFTFVIFNVLIMPTSSLALNTTIRSEKSDEAAKAQFDILYKEKVMHYEGSSDIYYYNANVEYTMNCYLSYYAFDETDSLEEHPQYGHKDENEVIRHFFFDIRNDKNAYLDQITKFNEQHNYFQINGDEISVIDSVKTNIKLSFFSPNDMSQEGKDMLANMQNGFMNFYASVFKDIKKNDITHDGKSYLEYQHIVDVEESFFQWHLVIASIVSYLISLLIYYLIIPFLHSENRTLAMMMMRVTRIGTNNLYTLGNIENFLQFVYMIAFNAPVVFFMPMTYAAFTYLFSIPLLPGLLLIGIFLSLISFIFVLVTPWNQTLCDKLSKSVIIKNEDLDEIYRAKGYNV